MFRSLVTLLALAPLACCVDHDRASIPEGVEETASCAGAAADAPAIVVADRRLCGLGEFPVDAILGDYHDDAIDGYTLDADRFTAELDAAFTAARPRGYAWVLVRGSADFDARVIARGSGGLALSAADAGGPAVPFAPETPSNLGSVTKFLAALALVHAHAHAQAGRPEGERASLRALLQVPFVELLPERWQARYAVDNGLADVRVGELLLHTSHLVAAGGDPEVDDIVEGLDHNAGVDALADAPLDYSNLNYRLLYPLIAALLDPQALRAVEREAADRCDQDFDDRYLRAAAAITREHLRGVVLDAVPGAMPATECDPERLGADWERRYARAYRDDADERGHHYNSFRENRGYCSTTGGWFASADDLGALLWSYHNGLLIDDDDRAVLEGGSGMGWFILGRPLLDLGDPALAAEVGGLGVLRKHGAQPIRGEDDVYRASIYKLPYAHYVALVVNSSYGDGSSQGNRTLDVLDAFAAAITVE
ncbi:MAG: serine hydrolase [Nannocystaceae bacterium]